MDETSTRVCCAGVVVGTEEQWKSLEREWVVLTDGIPFHANDCDSDRGSYAVKSGQDADQNHKRNKKLYCDLVTLLARSELHGYAATLDVAEFKAAFPKVVPSEIYYKAVADVIEFVKNDAVEEQDVAKITFDSRVQTEYNLTRVYANMREDYPEWKIRLADELLFAMSNNNLRIQVADLFSREAMKDLDNVIGPKKRPVRRSWQSLTESGRFKSFIYDSAFFRKMIPDLDGLAKREGFTRKEYDDWLHRRNRQHSDTAYIEFYHWYKTGKVKA